MLFALLGKPPLEALALIFIAPLTSLRGIAELTVKATPLILIAIGLAAGFRGGIWNIGAENQFTVGALAGGSVALAFYPATGWWLLPLMALAGIAGGAAWGAIPALLRTRFNANEILVSLMLSYVAVLLLGSLVHGPLRDPDGMNFPESRLFQTALPLIVPGTRAHVGFLVALLAAALAWVLLEWHLIGFQIKVLGLAPRAASFGGFSESRLVWLCFLLSGGCAGLAGLFEAAGPVGQLVPQLPAGYGFTAIIVAERAGVLNLGVEGMMIVGAIAGFSAIIATRSVTMALLASAVAGAVMAALFAVLVLTLRANQVASGLALTMFGLGLSALWGQGYSGLSAPAFPHLNVPALSDLPLVGKLLFGQDLLVYLSLTLVLGVALVLKCTRTGLILRAVDENHDAAHALGYPVIACRYGAAMFGGAMAGLGGAYLSLVQTPLWVERMTAGRGWIALALVVFAAWRPWRVLLGAYLFGGITVLQLHSQALGAKVDAQLLSMLPYLATIVVLVLISRDTLRLRLSAPACLGKPFHVAT